MRLMDRARTALGRSRAAVRVLAVGGVALLGLAACNSSDPVGDVAKGPASNPDAAVEMVGGSFEPETLNLKAGDEVTVEVTNNDSTAHDFAIEELNLNTGMVEADEVATATFTVPDDGVEFVCTLHPDMTGRIEVK